MSKQTVFDLVTFIDNEVTSIEQALRHIAQTNIDNAAEIEAENPAVARVLRESAASWREKADRLAALYEELSDSDLEWLDDAARGWVRT